VIPQINKTAQQVIVSIPNVEVNNYWYICYRTERQKNFQMRKMHPDTSGNAIYHLPTNMLYGKNVEYFIVKKGANVCSRTPIFTIVDANANSIPEIYFIENSPLENQANPAQDPFLTLSGSMSGADRFYQKEEDESKNASLNGNLRVFRNINAEKYQFDFDSSFSIFSPKSDSEKAINFAGLMVRFKKGNHQIAMGDLNINQSEYTAPSLNRRGINYEFVGQKLYFNIFLANSQQLSGFDGIGIPPSDAGIIGAVVGTNIGPSLKIRGLILSGQDNLNRGKTITYEENPFRAGNIFSFWGDLSLLKNRLQLTGEYARSSFGTSAAEEIETSQKNDNAWRSGFTYNHGIINASATYRWIGENFNSIANLFQQNDRDGIDSNLGLTIKTLSINVSYINQKSYLHTLSQDGQRQKRLSTNIGWQIDSRWRIGTDFSLDNLDYNSKNALPAVTPDMDTLNFSGNLGYTSASSNFSLTLGKIKSGNFTSNFSGQLACSLRFGQFMNLSPIFSYQNSKDLIGNNTSNIYNININSEITFIPQWFTFTCSGAYMRNVGDSFKSTAIMANANLNFFMAMLFKDKIHPVLAAKGEFQSNKSADFKTTNVSFRLQFDISF
jgi:hypothetical protein